MNSRKNIGGVHYVEYGWNFAHWTVTFSTVPTRVVNWKVAEVRVRKPFERYQEFGPDAKPHQRCADGWQNTNTPAWVVSKS